MPTEDRTYETILARMIGRITTQYPELDTREGGIIFNALASAAMELTNSYASQDSIRNECFAATASLEGLYQLCDEVGIDTFATFTATKGIFKAEFDAEVPPFSRWNLGNYNYSVVYEIEEERDEEQNKYFYALECEIPGTGANGMRGDLTPVDYVNTNLTVAKITECLIAAQDDWTEDQIRAYYYAYVNRTNADGNISQYGLWCTENPAIGNYRVFPLEDGPNTVTVSILNADNGVASQTLIDEFQEQLDPKTLTTETGTPIPQGMGNGDAPIGAIVTVDTATEKTINVTGSVKFEAGYDDTTILDNAIREFFKEIAYQKSAVQYMTLGARLLDATGIDFVSMLTINSGTTDVALGDKEIPILGSTSWTVVT